MMTHEERVWHHEMETLEGIHEHAERIASLEELVQDMEQEIGNLWSIMSTCIRQRRSPNAYELVEADMNHARIIKRMYGLDIEVKS